MAKVFLDANYFIDIVEMRRDIDIDQLAPYQVFVSLLSVHILLYITKKKVPDERLSDITEKFYTVPLDFVVTSKALIGPTSDFEDNAQLHSAVESNCSLFLTSDQKLLKMKFFGKTKIVQNL